MLILRICTHAHQYATLQKKTHARPDPLAITNTNAIGNGDSEGTP